MLSDATRIMYVQSVSAVDGEQEALLSLASLEGETLGLRIPRAMTPIIGKRYEVRLAEAPAPEPEAP